jgi:SpoVK/Ycf46/Vps4 family AAA+-type ATPase
MKIHISNKNLQRQYYFNNTIKYIVTDFINNHKKSIEKNKKRYLYYNLSHKYILEDKIVRNKVFKNTDTQTSTTASSLDLASPSLLIKGTGLIPDINQVTTYSPPKISFLKPNKSTSTMTNTFNVLDLLLPELSSSKPLSPDPILESVKRPFQYTDEEISYDFHILKVNINDLSDLIDLGKKYEKEFKPMKKKFNLNLRVLSDMVPHLEDLNKMIGMENIKNAIFDKIILFLQGLDDNPNDYHHIVLYGGPGMGKTVVAKIIGKIYAKMGLLSKGDFKEITITDLKGGYIGQSEIKTQKILDESKGCVVFMDEAYSLGSDDKIDSYSQGIIDLINPYLDKFRNDFIFIIAGYKKDLDSRFFRGNQGLKSRFGLWLEIEKYNAQDLREIFIKKVLDNNWKTDKESIPLDFFDHKKEVFKFFGRDIENLFSKCKIAHAKRVLFGNPEDKKNITEDDLIKGYELYKLHMPVTEKNNTHLELMYT